MTGLGQRARLTEPVYIELVCSLFGTLTATIIMAASFLMAGSLIVADHHDPLLFGLFMAANLAAMWRIVILLLHRQEVQARRFSAVRAGRLERRLAIPYFAFAFFFGLFAGYGFILGANPHRLLIVGLVFGYGAGVSAGLALRPWIGIPSIMLAIMPMILAAFIVPGRWGIGVLTMLFLVAACESMVRRYQTSSRQFTMQRLLSSIDRHDGLTGLPNQVLLREHFDAITESTPGAEMIAIHCLVVDDIDAINDSHGRPAGDVLLKAIAQRLARSDKGFIARLGGLRFAVVQPRILHERHAEALAQQIVATVSRPYLVSGDEIQLRAHIGFALDVQQGADLDRLIDLAGRAANHARREARDVVGLERPGWATELRRNWSWNRVGGDQA
jgi:diguanylate cyclase